MSTTSDTPSTWRTLRLTGAHGPERLLADTVRPWAENALGADAIAGWALDRTPEALILGVRGGGTPSAELHGLLDEALSATAAGHVEEIVWPGWADWPEGYPQAATALAAELIGATRSRPKRLRAAVGLLLTAADTVGPLDTERLRWLREHAHTRTTPDRATRARKQAEVDLDRNQAEWRRHHAAVREELRTPGTRLADWRAVLADALDRGPADLHRLAELINRQLGLSTEEQAYAAWLASLAALPGPHEPYFADGLDAVDRRYHEDSKFNENRMIDQRPDLIQAETRGRAVFGPVLETVPLPDPADAVPAGTPSFTDVLLARRSGYGSYRGPFSLAELSTLLHHAAGITAVKRPGPDTSYRVRPYPSGGTRYPLQLVLYCHDIEGLERGLYRYEPEQHALEQLDTVDLSADLRRCAPATDPNEPAPPKVGGVIDAEHCPLWVFTVGDLTYQRLHYGLRSYRLVLQETGHLAQNLALTATWLGKTSVGLSGYYDDAVNHLVGVDGVNSAVLYLHVFGVTEG